MRVPDCRTDENYNQKYLQGADKEFVRGYDWCTETAVDNFFNNLDVYFDSDSHLIHMLNERIPEEEEYEIEFTFGEIASEKRTVETYADLIRANILDWIEMERNELITSMIDNMDEEEYNKVKGE